MPYVELPAEGFRLGLGLVLEQSSACQMKELIFITESCCLPQRHQVRFPCDNWENNSFLSPFGTSFLNLLAALVLALSSTVDSAASWNSYPSKRSSQDRARKM